MAGGTIDRAVDYEGIEPHRGEWDADLHFLDCTFGAHRDLQASGSCARPLRTYDEAVTTLVVGPTCSGKSTYIAQSSLDSTTSTLLGFEVPERGVPEGINFIHYNLFHPWEAANFDLSIADQLRAEPNLTAILRSGLIKRAVVLVASPDDLRERIMRRDRIEPLLRPDEASEYRPQQWKTVLDSVDLFRMYEELFRLLDEFGVEMTFVCSKGAAHDESRFTDVDRLFVHRILRGEPVEVQPSPSEVARVTALPGAHYQIVELPGSASTDARGFNHVALGRSKTFDVIFNSSDLRGVSMLDVGCALGDFLLRAELRGARQLVGLEPHPERFEAARSIGELRKSSAVFFNERLDESSTSRRLSSLSPNGFNWVLALNVLHHVSDIHGFVSEATALASQHLVFEYPTFKDSRWQSDNHKCGDGLGTLTSDLPLIGVGVRGYDQRFVFSDGAVTALVAAATDRLKPAVWHESPIEDRRIVVFCSESGCPDCLAPTQPLDVEAARPNSTASSQEPWSTRGDSVRFWLRRRDQFR